MGCERIVIVSGGNNIGGFAEYLGNGSRYGVEFTYKVQTEAGGIAQALLCAERMVRGLFPVILGDNYFEKAPEMPESPAVFIKRVANPNRFGVLAGGKIYEKPKVDIGNQAVTGLYVYDEWCFDIIKELEPSDRGELEITDVNNRYLEHSDMEAVPYSSHWSDMGTYDSLLETANYIRNKNG